MGLMPNMIRCVVDAPLRVVMRMLLMQFLHRMAEMGPPDGVADGLRARATLLGALQIRLPFVPDPLELRGAISRLPIMRDLPIRIAFLAQYVLDKN